MDSFSSLGFSKSAFSNSAFDFDEAAEAAGTITEAFAVDHSRLHLLPNEIAQRRRLLMKMRRDKDIQARDKRRRRELELLSLYALTKKAA